MLDYSMSKDDRREINETLRYGFMLLILLDFIFVCYIAFCLSITQNFYKKLKSMEYQRTFQTAKRSTTSYEPSLTYKPVCQNPSAPPPYNPHYKDLSSI